MNLYGLLSALFLGALFAVFTMLRPDFHFQPNAIRFVIAVGVFGAYCGLVIAGASGKKRELSLGWQTLLGVLCALVIASLFRANGNGYVASGIIGLGLGFTADYWVKHVQLP